MDAEYIMWNARLDEAQAGIKIAEEISIKWRGTKELLDEGERGEWKSWLKTHIKKTKHIESGPITSWQIDGDTVRHFIFLGSKITLYGDYSH